MTPTGGPDIARSWAAGALGLRSSVGRGSGAGPLRRRKLKRAAREEKGLASQKARKGEGGKRNSFFIFLNTLSNPNSIQILNPFEILIKPNLHK